MQNIKLQSKKLSIQNLLCSKTDLWGEYEICLDSEKYKALLRAFDFFLTPVKNKFLFMMAGWKDL